MGKSQKNMMDFAQMRSSLGESTKIPDDVRTGMENSFRTDLSGVNLYESDMVADGGAEAVASGNDIAFAPGKMNFDTMEGRTLLGHELSHVVSQSRGEVSGHGVVNDAGFESRADSEGMHAAEMSFSDDFGGSGAELSPMGAGLEAAAPMQYRK